MVRTDLKGNGPGAQLPTEALSCSEQLRNLLIEIEDTAEDSDIPTPVTESLSRIKHCALEADDRTAGMILEAIQLGEDFACLYIQNFLQFPNRPRRCGRPSQSCT